ncbi:hypothetical protein GQ42DRAFT_46252 [Ramicandelaber brevisporus]|nr:hypothetical protein GQ42DRAFT_46252 [Ramicandelaber brevisporus]
MHSINHSIHSSRSLVGHEVHYGYIEDAQDAAYLFQAALNGDIQLWQHRPKDTSDVVASIRSGTIFGFELKKGSFERFNDHMNWSPTRAGNRVGSSTFMVYHEVNEGSKRKTNTGHSIIKRRTSDSAGSSDECASPDTGIDTPLQHQQQQSQAMLFSPAADQHQQLQQQQQQQSSPFSPLPRCLQNRTPIFSGKIPGNIGTCRGTGPIKPGGYRKHGVTCRVEIGGKKLEYRFINYLKDEDIQQKRLLRPSQDPAFAHLVLCEELKRFVNEESESKRTTTTAAATATNKARKTKTKITAATSSDATEIAAGSLYTSPPSPLMSSSMLPATPTHSHNVYAAQAWTQHTPSHSSPMNYCAPSTSYPMAAIPAFPQQPPLLSPTQSDYSNNISSFPSSRRPTHQQTGLLSPLSPVESPVRRVLFPSSTATVTSMNTPYGTVTPSYSGTSTPQYPVNLKRRITLPYPVPSIPATPIPVSATPSQQITASRLPLPLALALPFPSTLRTTRSLSSIQAETSKTSSASTAAPSLPIPVPTNNLGKRDRNSFDDIDSVDSIMNYNIQNNDGNVPALPPFKNLIKRFKRFDNSNNSSSIDNSY